MAAASTQGLLSASTVAVAGTFAVAGLLFLLGPAAVLQVGLLGMLSPRVVHRFAMVAASGADVANPPQVSSTLSDEQLRLGWRNSFIALQRTTLPGERLLLLETRAALLEVFAHRDPQAFTDWLHNAHAASTPPPCLTAAVRDAPTPPSATPNHDPLPRRSSLMSDPAARPPRRTGPSAAKTGAVAQGTPRRRPGWLIPLLALLALLLIGLLLYFLLRGPNNTTTVAPTTTATATATATATTTATSAAPATAGSAGAASAPTGPAPSGATSAGAPPAGGAATGGGPALVGGGGVAVRPATGALASAGPGNGGAGALGAQPRGTVLFPSDSAALDGGAQQVITSAAQRILATHPAKVTVTAYTTDAPGAQPSTSDVSQQRADTVAATLKADLASPNIPIEVVSKGSADPIASNDTAEGRQLNRRVAITTS